MCLMSILFYSFLLVPIPTDFGSPHIQRIYDEDGAHFGVLMSDACSLGLRFFTQEA